MNLFYLFRRLFPKKVSKEDFGWLVFDAARTRSKIFSEDAQALGFPCESFRFYFYAILYNLVMMENMLWDRYGEDTADEIMKSAYNVFYKTFKPYYNHNDEGFGLFDIEDVQYKTEMKSLDIWEALSLIDLKEPIFYFDNKILRIAKMFCEDVFEEEFSEDDVDTKVCIELYYWITKPPLVFQTCSVK